MCTSVQTLVHEDVEVQDRYFIAHTERDLQSLV